MQDTSGSAVKVPEEDSGQRLHGGRRRGHLPGEGAASGGSRCLLQGILGVTLTQGPSSQQPHAAWEPLRKVGVESESHNKEGS